MEFRKQVIKSLLKTLWPDLADWKINNYSNKCAFSTLFVEIETLDKKEKRTITFRYRDYTMVDYRDGTTFIETQPYSDFASGWVSDNFENVKKKGNTISRVY